MNDTTDKPRELDLDDDREWRELLLVICGLVAGLVLARTLIRRSSTP